MYFQSLADSDEEERATLRSTRRGRAKQARTSISNESNNVAAFTQPPKERPDAKNHLKVSQNSTYTRQTRSSNRLK